MAVLKYWDGAAWQLVSGGGGSVTWPLLAPDGSAAAPSYGFGSSAAGLYSNGLAVNIASGGVVRMAVGGTTVLYNGLQWGTDNTNDIGNNLSARPRNLYLGGNLDLGGTRIKAKFDEYYDANSTYFMTNNAVANGSPNTYLTVLPDDTPGNVGSTTGINLLDNPTVASAHYLLLQKGYNQATVSSDQTLYIGTAASAVVNFVIGGFTRWTLNTSNHIVPATSNTNDIGTSSLPVRALYVGTSIATPALIPPANIFEQRNSTSPQVWRLYNTYTDTNNYERFVISWGANQVSIQNEAAGTGSIRPIIFNGGTATVNFNTAQVFAWQTNSATKWAIVTSEGGHWRPGPDNALDLGTAANRVRNVYVGSGIGIGTSPATDRGLGIGTAALAGTAQYGAVINPPFTSAATTLGTAVYAGVQTQAAAFTMTDAHAFRAWSPNLGAGSSITNTYGIRVESQGGTGITNAYGVYIAAQAGASTTNIGLYNAGTTQLVGAVTLPNGTAQALLGRYEGQSISWSTALTGWQPVTPAQVTVTVTSGTALLRVECGITLSHSAANGSWYVTLGQNGNPYFQQTFNLSPTAGVPFPVSFTRYLGPVSPGSYTFQIFVYNNVAGTLTAYANSLAWIYVTEQRC